MDESCRNQGADFKLKDVLLIDYITFPLDASQVSRYLVISAPTAAGTRILARHGLPPATGHHFPQ